MSSGARRLRACGRGAPARTQRSSAAASTSSSRVSGKSRPFGHARRARGPARPTRCRKRRDRARGARPGSTRSTSPMSMPELERRRGHERPQRARLQPLLGVEPPLAREAAVVAGDRVLAQQLGELGRDALGHLARVDEDERRAVLADQLGHPRVDLRPTARASRRWRAARAAPRRRGRASRNVPASTSAHSRPAPTRKRADLVERLLRGGEADALQRAGRPAPPAARARAPGARRACRATRAWISSTITVRTVAQHRAAAVAREQEVERLRRRDQDVRRPLAPSPRARAAGVSPGADQHAHLGQRRVERADLRQRALQVLLDVVGERAQRRDVERPASRRRRSAPWRQQRVDRGQERGQRLARAGRRRDQDVAALRG